MRKYIDDESELLKVLAQNIKFYRTKKNISQEELSIQIDKPKDYIYQLENLKLNEEIDSWTAARISLVLGISLDKLVRKRRKGCKMKNF